MPMNANKLAIGILLCCMMVGMASADLTIPQGFTAQIPGYVASSGALPYTYQWFSECPSCSSFNSISGATNTVYFFITNISTATGNWLFLIQGRDSAAVVSNSPQDTVIVIPQLVSTSISTTSTTTTIPSGLSASISPASTTVASGGQVTFAASVTGGTPPYSYIWTTGASASCASDTTLVSQTGNQITVSVNTASYYCYQVTDSALAQAFSPGALVSISSGGNTGGPGSPEGARSSVSSTSTVQPSTPSSSTKGTIGQVGTLVLNWLWLILIILGLVCAYAGIKLDDYLWMVPAAMLIIGGVLLALGVL